MSIRTLRSGASLMAEDIALAFITDLIRGSGVFDVTGTSLQVVAQASPDMTVKVKAGRAYLLASAGNGYPVIVDVDTTTAAHTANASGNPRIDAVVLYVNLSATPASDGSGVGTIAIVAGTAGASPVPPTTGQIQTAIGASNPYIILSNEAIASGAVNVTNGNITDKRSQVAFRNDVINQTKWVTPTVNVGGTTTLDLLQGNKFQVTMGAGNTTFALLNVPLNCKSILVRITQDGVGSRTVTWMSGGSWPNGVVPTLTTTASKSDEFAINFLTVTNDSTNTWEGVTVHQNV